MLTATQTKYARERVEAIYRRKSEKLSSAYHDQDKLSNEERINFLQVGNFVVEEGHYRWYDAIKFPERPGRITAEVYKAQSQALTKERDGILDELVLGDAEGALAAIKRFEESPDGLAA